MAVKRDEKGRFIKGTSAANPKGRPKDGESWSGIIRAIGDMYPDDITEFIGKDNDLGRMVAKFPKGVQMKYLITARVFASLMFEPTSGLWNGLMDRADGKVGEPLEAPKEEINNYSIPADMIARDFLDIYRDIRAGNNSEYALDGGRGSTKSSFIAEAIIMLIVNNPDMHALALRQVKDTLRDSVFTQLKWAIDILGFYDRFKTTTNPLEITYLPTGQKIYFRGGDDPTNIKSIKPAFGYIGLLWFEEFDQFRGEAAIRSIVQSALRGGDKAYRFESWNTPRSANHWVNKYMAIPKPGRYHLHTTYETVPKEWLGRVFLDEAEFIKEVNPAAYEHEYLGIANSLGGMVFENVIIREIPDEEIATFNGYNDGIDWGYYPHPYVWGRSYYDPARLTLYIYDEYYAFKQSNRETYDHLVKEKLLSPNDLIIADSAEPKSIADYREYGANIRGAEKGQESVNYSIKWLQSLKAIIIDEKRAPYHAREFLDYELEQTKDGEFISAYPDKNNHCIDRTRYAHNLIWRVRGK